MKGIGVDIVDLKRIDLTKSHFIDKILTQKEKEKLATLTSDKRRIEFIGGRFAAKEAYMKANQKGIGQISFQDIEILNDESGAPYLNDPEALISISHENEYAIAFVIRK